MPNVLVAIQKVINLALTGLQYQKDPFDKERYQQILDIGVFWLARVTGGSEELIQRSVMTDEGYPTPKIEVRGGLFRDDHVLLVREKTDEKWSLPGGWADVGATLSETLKAEFVDETGLSVAIKQLAFVDDRRLHNYGALQYFHIVKLFFLVDAVGGIEQGPFNPDEIHEIGYFPVTSLPELSTLRVTQEQISRLYEYHKAPGGAVAFD